VIKIMKSENLSLESHIQSNINWWKSLFHPESLDELWEINPTYTPTIRE
jgi:hypothetical protein